MRALHSEQASACENATGGRCRCRCGGALHGAARGIPLDQLPADDPHYTPPPGGAETAARLEQLEHERDSARIALRGLLEALEDSGSERNLSEPVRLAMARARLELM